MASDADNLPERQRKARAKWQRIEEFWGWAGRAERGEALVQCFQGSEVQDAVQQTFSAATQGGNLAKGGTTMQKRTAWPLVGAVLGCSFRGGPIMDSGPGQFASADLRTWLAALSTKRREQLAERWVTYLRSGVARPEPWQSLTEGQTEVVAEPPDPANAAQGTEAWPALDEQQRPEAGDGEADHHALDAGQRPGPAHASENHGKQAGAAMEAAKPTHAPPTSAPAAGTATASEAPATEHLPSTAARETTKGWPRALPLTLIGLGLLAATLLGGAWLGLPARTPEGEPESADPQKAPDPQGPAPTQRADTPTQARATPKPEAAAPAVSITARRGDKRFEVTSGDTLRSGDRFAFTVRAEEPLFVQLVTIDDGGAPSLAYPPEGSRQLPADSPRRVPSDEEGWFQLDEDVGTERLLVLLTTRPLARKKADLSGQLAPLMGSEPWPEEWPRVGSSQAGPRPAAASATRGGTAGARVYTRGVRLVPHGQAQAKADAKPTLVQVEFITLEHR